MKTLITTLAVAAIAVLATPAEARDRAAGAAKAKEICAACHGMDGKGNFETPPIAGLKEDYIVSRLKGFKSGAVKTTDGLMHMYTEDWSDQELQDLAAYWASRKP